MRLHFMLSSKSIEVRVCVRACMRAYMCVKYREERKKQKNREYSIVHGIILKY